MVKDGIVIVLHGLGRTGFSMRRIERRLEQEGWAVESYSYPSRSATIEELAAGLFRDLPREGKLHFVGHSLGGILAKHLMLTLPSERRGRIVQLGAPNLGSEVAERYEILSPIMGPALGELKPQQGIDDAGLDIGAIAGTAAHELYGHLTGIEGENDGKVSVASAWGNAPEGKRIKLPVAHSTMMQNTAVIDAVVAFLETGHFAEQASGTE